MELQDVLEQRYSVRKFAPTKVATEDIEAILKAGSIAPTACNKQPQHIYVVTKDEDLAKMNEVSPCKYGAPCVLIVTYDDDIAAHRKNFNFDEGPWDFGELDISSVIVHMMLKATDLGLTTCWKGAFFEPQLKEAFGLPENIRVRALLDLGYPAEDYVPDEQHTDKRPLSETVTWL